MMPLKMSLTTVSTLIVIVFGLYLALGLALYLFQSRLIYFPNTPSRALWATPDDAGFAYETVELTAKDGVRLHGWFLPAATKARGVLLFFHGNAGNISHRLDSLKIFHDSGLAVLIIDYRGYGQSSGEVSEHGTYLDAEAAWHYLTKERRVPEREIVIFGRSLGAAIAADLAAKHEPGALILESGFTSVPDMAAELYRIFPVRWLTTIKYPTQTSLGNVKSPVLIIHSVNDEIIPFHHGEALFEAANEPKTFLKITGGHNDGFLTSGRVYEDGIHVFLTEHIGQKRLD